MASPGAQACDLRVVALMQKIPVVPEDRGSRTNVAMYWEPDAQTSRIAHLQPYWYARAGCDAQAAQAAAQSPEGPAYALAGKIRRTRQLSPDDYAVLARQGLLPLVKPVLGEPGNAALLERYARTPPKAEGDDVPLEEAFDLLHARRDEAAAVALVERVRPDLARNNWPFVLRYGFAKYRLGQKKQGWAVMTPVIDAGGTLDMARAGVVDALASTGHAKDAPRLIAQAPAARRSALVKTYLAAGGDPRWVQRYLGAMSACDRSSVAAMDGRYLEAIEWADRGRCETVYGFVPPKEPQRLTQRYVVPDLYTIAALRGEGLVFRALARRAGATSFYHHMPTLPVAMYLISVGRDPEARAMLLEDAGTGERPPEKVPGGFDAWSWEEIAFLATPTFSFEDWIDIRLKAETEGYVANLVHLAQSFAMNQPDRALAWYARVHEGLTERQRGDVSIGLVRGLVRTDMPGESKFKPPLPAPRDRAA